MAVYAIGDLHLSLGGNHSMEVFPGWQDYVRRIQEGWKRLVKSEDTVVLVGDTSWGMSMESALADFRYLEDLPGKKYLIKGNHDYWWATKAKMDVFFAAHGLKSLEILHNNAVKANGIALCGSRGWMLETGQPHDEKMVNREVGRLRMSLDAGRKIGLESVVFLHYPPLYGKWESSPIMDVLVEYGVQRCYYGHIHHKGCHSACQGKHQGVELTLISSDYRNFVPVLVQM